ncbi:hypothetical protein HU200_025591 [Digitaria exilis]|uniref:Strictosidine synthase conserved region domain-containing protein n=1 Tax=Digitaria exilis TaxID=1010633 RepID=A0A835BZI3_9POAL|nr:hypothetical protein HU200_025591 [Digitaria exilis]
MDRKEKVILESADHRYVAGQKSFAAITPLGRGFTGVGRRSPCGRRDGIAGRSPLAASTPIAWRRTGREGGSFWEGAGRVIVGAVVAEGAPIGLDRRSPVSGEAPQLPWARQSDWTRAGRAVTEAVVAVRVPMGRADLAYAAMGWTPISYTMGKRAEGADVFSFLADGKGVTQTKAPTPWGIQAPKPGSAIKSLSLERRHQRREPRLRPESLAFDRRGQGPYAGVSDGRVESLAFDRRVRDPTPAAERLPFDRRGQGPYADAYLGLMKVGPGGGKTTVLATEADGVSFNFVNGIDVDQRNNMILINRDTTGRLLKYDTRRRRVTVLRAGLPYPNGVAVSADRTHVVGPKVGHYELFVDLPGYADNIRRDASRGYWFALNREDINATSPDHLVGVRVDAKGTELQVMTAPEGITLSDIA